MATDKLSYKQLDELSDALAAALSDLGIEKSDRVAVSLGHCIEYATASLDSLKMWLFQHLIHFLLPDCLCVPQSRSHFGTAQSSAQTRTSHCVPESHCGKLLHPQHGDHAAIPTASTDG